MHGQEVGSLYYDLDINDKSLTGQLDKADKKVASFGDRINKYWGNSVDASKKFALGLTAVTAGVVAFGVSSVKAFQESEDMIAQTNAVLKSTGGIAKVTADQVTDLATALQKSTKFSDEQVRSAENLLLTFTSIGKDIFPQATKTVLDMSTALGQDTKSSAVQLGKALQDPILGVTALRRVGVNFGAAQQEVIAKLVETGQKAKAQRMILKELHTEFGGSAEAAGKTYAGALARLKNQLNDVQEAIGGLIVKAVTPLVGWLADLINKAGGYEKIQESIMNGLKKIKPYFSLIGGAIAGILTPAVIAMTIAFGEFLLTIAPWAALGAGIVLLFKHLGVNMSDVIDFAKKIGNVFGEIKNTFKQVFDYLEPKVTNLINAFRDFGPKLQTFVSIYLWPFVQAVAVTAGKSLVWAIGQVIDKATWLLDNVLTPLFNFMNNNKGIVLGLATAFGILYTSMLLGKAIGAITTGLTLLTTATIPGLVTALGRLVTAWGPALPYLAVAAFVGWFAQKMNQIKKDYDDMYDHINKYTDTLSNNVKTLVKDFKNGKITVEQEIKGLKVQAQLFDEQVSQSTTKGFWASLAKHLPSFDTGGTVPGREGAPQLIIAHGGEEVIPNGQTGKNGNTTVYIDTINNSQDEEYVMRRIDTNQRRVGLGLSPMR